MIDRRQFVQGLGALLPAASLSLAPGAARAADAPYAWRSLPFGAGGFVDGFVYHPREPGLLYARTDIGGAYRYEPATHSWTPLLDFLGRADGDLMGVLALAVDANDAKRVYAACGIYTGQWSRQAALLASSDRGATWQINELPFKLGGNEPGRGTGERLQVSPHDGQQLWLGTSKDGLWRSADGGRAFTAAPLAVRHVSLVVLDPRDAKTVYAGSHDAPGLYASRDGGASFAREPGTPAQVPQRAAFGADGTLYVSFALGPKDFATNPGNALEGGVWKRSPAGAWTEITPVRPGRGEFGFGYSGVDVDVQRPGRIIVSTIERWTEGDELFLSTDDGRSWTALGARSRHDASPYPWLVDYMKGQDRMGHWLADVKLDPFDPERAVYGTGYGLWFSRNLGAALKGGRVDWDFTVAGFEETATLDIKSPSGGATLLAAMGDVAGAAWDDVAKPPAAGLFRPSYQTNRSVDYAEARPALIARTADTPTGGYVSLDGSASWRPFGATALRDAKRPSGHVAVSAKGTALLWAPEKQAALVSHDLGRTWAAVEGWPATREHELVPVADRAVDGVFHVFDPALGELRVSADGGRTFTAAVTGLGTLRNDQKACLVSGKAGLRRLWLALPDGLVHFAGADAPMKQNKFVAEAWLVALGKGPSDDAPQSLYVWGRVWRAGQLVEGIFRADDAGAAASFTRVNDDRHRWGYVLSLAADPLDYGTVYVAAHGRGVLVGKPR
ncbi:MAG: hypothetical protein JO224_04095 [Pelomonas sp.]|nr:hypothetical protein [Roseateles sp.]